MGGLIRTALRLTATKALAGRTFAGENVQDSSIQPLAEAIQRNPKPIIIVYTDEDDHPLQGLDLLTPTAGSVSMVFLVAMAGSTRLDNGAYQITFPPTDFASELTLDILETDIKLALLDPRNDWADLWRRFALHATRWRSQRGANEEQGARFAARQLIIDLDPLADPAGGAEPADIWAELIALVAADPDPDFAGLSDVLARAIRGRAVLTDWEREQMLLGLTRMGGWASGLPPAPVPYPVSPGDPTVPLSEVDVDASLAAGADWPIVSTPGETEGG